MSEPSLTLTLQSQVLEFNQPPTYEVTSGARIVRLFGDVEFIVDYKEIRLHRARREDVEEVLRCWSTASDLFAHLHEITELEGCYLVTVEENGQAVYLCTGHDSAFPVYYAYRGEDTFLSSQWIEVIRWLGQVEVSEESLRNFLTHERTDMPNTLFKGLYVMRPYSLYQIDPGKLTLVKHSFPGLHTVKKDGLHQYEVMDYVRAAGAYEEHFDSFSLGFSGGTDSRTLAYAYQNRLEQLLTILYEPPYMSLERCRSQKAAEKLSRARDIQFTPVPVDWNDTATLEPYLIDFAQVNPFSTHLPAHFYHMAMQSEADILLSGILNDKLWGWGLYQIALPSTKSRSTSSHPVSVDLRQFRKRGLSRSLVAYFVNRYGARWAMMISFRKPRLRWLAEHYHATGPEFEELWRYPYKVFVLNGYAEFAYVAVATVWNHAGRYAGKRTILPYTSPLALHVGSQIPRENFFDLKAPLREIYSEFDDSSQALPEHFEEGLKPYTAAVFHQPGVPEWNQQFVDAHSTTPIRLSELPHYPERLGFYQLHLHHLFRFVEEQLKIPSETVSGG